MITLFIVKFLWLVLLPLAVIWAVLTWLTESQPQRIRRWRSQGWSQKAIAERLGISTYAVRKALA